MKPMPSSAGSSGLGKTFEKRTAQAAAKTAAWVAPTQVPESAGLPVVAPASPGRLLAMAAVPTELNDCLRKVLRLVTVYS
jgi:hypothetical protein